MPTKASLPVTDDSHGDMCDAMSPGDQALIRDVLARVVDRWSLWALSELTEDGPLRFSRLLGRLEGVSQKSLTATLRELERDGFITRTVTVQVPIRVDYEATPLAWIIREADSERLMRWSSSRFGCVIARAQGRFWRSVRRCGLRVLGLRLKGSAGASAPVFS